MADRLACVLSDSVMLWVLESGLVLFSLFAALILKTPILGWSGIRVTRGNENMGRFAGWYAAVAAVLVAIPLAVEAARPYRVALVLLNVAISVYLCFVNRWTRNGILTLFEKARAEPPTKT